MVEIFYYHTDGTIRASKSFQSNSNSLSYLLTFGDDNNGNNKCTNSQNACYQNIAIENMMFDCQYTMISVGVPLYKCRSI